MKYGCGTTIDNYSILQALCFDYIELPGNQISQMTDDEFNALKTILENGSVKCCGFNAALTPDIVITGEGYDLEKAKAYAELLCKRGSQLHISAIGIGSPKSRKFQEGDDLEKAWKETEAFMTMFADVAAPYGIIVMYESLNHTESAFGLRIREGADLVKKINRPNLKIVFDIYHMAMEQEDIQELEYALPYVHHIHIAERVGAERRYPSDALYDYYKKLLTPVIRSGYQGAICTEAFDGDVREGAERSIHLLKKIVTEIEQEG